MNAGVLISPWLVLIIPVLALHLASLCLISNENILFLYFDKIFKNLCYFNQVMINSNLDELLAKGARTKRTGNDPKAEKVLDYLDNQLASLGLEGKVVSVLTLAPHSGIHCYGKRLKGGEIFGKLNLSIDVTGSRIAGPIRYREFRQLTSYERGLIVPLDNPQEYVALVNVSLSDFDPDSNVREYPI